jgi:hypothetical protein
MDMKLQETGGQYDLATGEIVNVVMTDKERKELEESVGECSNEQACQLRQDLLETPDEIFNINEKTPREEMLEDIIKQIQKLHFQVSVLLGLERGSTNF